MTSPLRLSDQNASRWMRLSSPLFTLWLFLFILSFAVIHYHLLSGVCVCVCLLTCTWSHPPVCSGAVLKWLVGTFLWCLPDSALWAREYMHRTRAQLFFIPSLSLQQSLPHPIKMMQWGRLKEEICKSSTIMPLVNYFKLLNMFNPSVLVLSFWATP